MKKLKKKQEKKWCLYLKFEECKKKEIFVEYLAEDGYTSIRSQQSKVST